eukprot:3793957-Rhodomonas_salina.1
MLLRLDCECCGCRCKARRFPTWVPHKGVGISGPRSAKVHSNDACLLRVAKLFDWSYPLVDWDFSGSLGHWAKTGTVCVICVPLSREEERKRSRYGQEEDLRGWLGR